MTAETTTESTFETFDDLGDSETFETFDDPYDVQEEEPKAEKVKDDLKVIKDSQADSEGKVIKEDKKSTKKAEKEESDEEEDEEETEEEEDSEEEEEEVKDEKEEEEEEEKEEDKKPKSKLRVKMNGELFNIDSDATFKVKVDGKTEEVPVQELINNYSGKTAWDRKFTELGKEKKIIEIEKNSLLNERTLLQDHLAKALAPLSDPKANPFDSLMYLLDLKGEDPYNAWKRNIESNLDELGNLMDMTETERELYFLKKKEQLNERITTQRTERSKKDEAFNQAVQKVDELRQAFGISKEEFVDASDELEELLQGTAELAQLSERDVVEYASLRPHITVVKELITPYEDNISEDKFGEVVSELATYLRDGRADKKTLQDLLKKNFSVEQDVKELNTRVYSKQKGKPSKKIEESSDKYETFDDWN